MPHEPTLVQLPAFRKWFVVLFDGKKERAYELNVNQSKFSAHLLRADPPLDRLAIERARQTR